MDKKWSMVILFFPSLFQSNAFLVKTDINSNKKMLKLAHKNLTCEIYDAMFAQVLLVLDQTMAGQVQVASFTQVQPAIKSWR